MDQVVDRGVERGRDLPKAEQALELRAPVCLCWPLGTSCCLESLRGLRRPEGERNTRQGCRAGPSLDVFFSSALLEVL